MFYIERFENGNVKGLARRPQYKDHDEKLDDDDLEVSAFLENLEGHGTAPLSAAQFFTMLSILKVTDQDIDAMIRNDIVGATQKTFAREKLKHHNEYSSTDALGIAILALSNATQEEKDAAWKIAAGLR